MKRVINHSKDWKLTEDIKTGFTVPESYFTGIEDELFSKLIEEKLPKHNGFKTPKSYFEELEDLIIKKTEKGKVITLKRKKIKLISVAASIALLLFFGSNFIFNNNNTELSSEEIISWLDVNANSLSNDDIAFALTELNINDINPYLAIKNEDIVESLLNSNDLDYLIEDINTK
ncbi:hypothetical protein N9J13_00350 [Flavobacteriaceae bacterium]|nr:hypothetical protein [Flavobacteriaceae bacterium]